MAKFFRKIRQRLLNDFKFNQYLLYAIGEILLVVFGILIAFQIDAWNKQREQSKEEQRILHNLKTDLLNDIAQLDINIQSSLDRQANTDTLLTILAEPREHTVGRFLALVYPLFYESHFEVNSGTFDESLASGTIKYIKNDSLRQEIFEYYRDAKLSYADKNSLKMTYELILPQFAKTLAPSKDFVTFFAQKPTLLPNLNLSAIAQDKEFYTMLILKLGTEDDQVRNWLRYKKMAQVLLEKTEAQLQKK